MCFDVENEAIRIKKLECSVDLHQMNNLDILSHRLKILGQQSAMALLWTVFTAQEAMSVQTFDIGFLRDFATIEQVKVFCLVVFPGYFFIPVLGEHIFCGSEIEVVFVTHPADGFGEKSQILALGKPGKLGHVVDAGIHDFRHAAVAQQIEELPGGFVGEANGVELYHWFAVFSQSQKLYLLFCRLDDVRRKCDILIS